MKTDLIQDVSLFLIFIDDNGGIEAKDMCCLFVTKKKGMIQH